MEDVLDLYAEDVLVDYPVVCFDESPYQLVAETRQPLPAMPGQPARRDYEYRRAGTCNLFMLFHPGGAWRHVTVTDRRTKQDFAAQMRDLVDVHFPHATLISVVLDNLNTHSPASLYATFAPAEAKRILAKLEFRYTPKHGSWLNMAELEFAALQRQCLDRRLASQADVIREAAAWEAERNARKATVTWRFTTADARTKLPKLYPPLA
jgi:DDE superfamily endonuclease